MTSTVRTGQVGLARLAREGTSGPAPSGDRSWPRGGRGRTAVAMLSVLAAFWVAGCTSQGTGGSLGAASSSTPSSASASATASSVTALPSANRSESGAVSVPKNLKASVTAWGVGRGGAALKLVSGQVGVVLQATGLRQYATARSSCVKLATGVAAARSASPIPDGVMQQIYVKALTELGQGAAGCRTAISRRPSGTAYFNNQHDAEVLRQSTSLLSTGANDLYRATGEISALERR